MEKDIKDRRMKFPNKREEQNNIETKILVKKKGYTGMTIILLLMLFVIWEFWGRSYLLQDTLLVLKNDLRKGTVIQEDMLEEVKLENAPEGVLVENELEYIVGKKTLQYIHAGIPLFESDFIEANLAATELTKMNIFSMPMNWLDSYPQTLRKGDNVGLYLVGKTENNSPVVLTNVIHVKDIENKEIVGGGLQRLTSSPQIESIELLMTNEQLILLTSMAEYGNKFVLTYEQ